MVSWRLCRGGVVFASPGKVCEPNGHDEIVKIQAKTMTPCASARSQDLVPELVNSPGCKRLKSGCKFSLIDFGGTLQSSPAAKPIN